MSEYAVKVWLSTPEKVESFRQEGGAYYELPPEQIRLLTTEASNDNHARTKIEKMIEDTWGITKDKFEVVDVRRLN